MESQTPRGENLENLLDKPPKDPYEETSNFRFGSNTEDNPFSQPDREWVLILLTFPMWKSTNDTYYYNILKNKRSAKRKVTFSQTITIPPSNLLSKKQLRYQIRYQTRSNNSSEESSDNDDDDDSSDYEDNPLDRQPNQPLPPPPPSPPNQNMNDGNGGGNNLSNEQNNIIAQALMALVQTLGNLQPASV